MQKINLAVIYGGQSTEHEISIKSATSVVANLKQEKYNILLIKIEKDGTWYLQNGNDIQTSSNAASVVLLKQDGRVQLLNLNSNTLVHEVDIVFPVLHGKYGEDGTIQGLFRMLDLPFVGCDVFASAACMDKDYCKRLLQDQGIKIAPYRVAYKWNAKQYDFANISAELGTPLFIKPAHSGSSVGVHKVESAEAFEHALSDAFNYDTKVLIEQNIEGIEIECAILGNEEAKPSVLGAIIPQKDFYSFESKYKDEKGAQLQMPADIEESLADEIRSQSLKAFKVMNCNGLARVDFFLSPDEEYVLNEINTLPGFTSISMYPKLWELTGIAYADLLDQLIEFGLNRQY